MKNPKGFKPSIIEPSIINFDRAAAQEEARHIGEIVRGDKKLSRQFRGLLKVERLYI